MIKEITKKILFHPVRYILTILKNNCLPETKNSVINWYERDQFEKSYNTFKKFFPKSYLFTGNKKKLHKFIIEKTKENDKDNNKFNLEFGVFKGDSIKFFSKFVNKIYGFDSFEGLKENWVGTQTLKGSMSVKKKLPQINSNVVLIKGWVQDSLPSFLQEYNPSINFVHMDLDPYESTKFVLEKIKPYLSKKSIILFDELYNYPGWEEGEYKALNEVFQEDEYDFICFQIDSHQAAIQLK